MSRTVFLIRSATLLLTLLAVPGLSAAADVIGRAQSERGEPLRGREVRLGSLVTRADGEGRFVFRNVAPATYPLSCGGAVVNVAVRDGLNQLVCRGR